MPQDDEPPQAVRQAFVLAMLEDGASDEEIAAALASTSGGVFWASRQERSHGRRRTTVEESGSIPPTVAELIRLQRRLLGRRGGRASESAARIEAIIDELRELGPDASRDEVAAALGRADDGGNANSWFKADVSSAGGWLALRRRAFG